MDVREFAAQSMQQVRQTTLAVAEGLTPKQLVWQPQPGANHIGFILFHVFRVEDRYFHHRITKSGELWDQKGWSRRWKLPPGVPGPDISTSGFGWTAQQVAAFVPPPLAELRQYAAEVRDSALKIVRSLDLARLPQVADPEQPDVTVAQFLQRAVRHEAQHQGQIDYLLGLMKAGKPGFV
jgi:uncharacterized damage-inducible protein DinB